MAEVFMQYNIFLVKLNVAPLVEYVKKYVPMIILIIFK